jgi:hypothetical protein
MCGFGRYPIPLVCLPRKTRMPYKEAKQDEQSKSKQVQADSSRQLFAEKGCFDLDLDRSRIALLPGQVDRIWKRRGISSVEVNRSCQ